MSKFWESRLWETSSLKGTLLLAALAIADNADDSGVAWPGYILLAKKTRMSLRQVPRIITALESSQELAVRWGGSRRGDVNIYVFLIGRDPAEVGMLKKLVARKPDKLTVLKACQDVMLNNMPDKLTLKKGHNKHDMGIREASIEPLNMNGKNMDEWMNDPICSFLRSLPGYNPAALEADRAALVEQHYSVEGLQYLYDDCTGADNPIGLFLYRAGQGQHSPTYLDALAERKRLAAIVEQPAPREQPQRIEPDETVTDQHVMLWRQIISEIGMQVSDPLNRIYVLPAHPVSINGAWRIAVPDLEWWNAKMPSTLKRIARGLLGHDIEFEFVQDGAR